MDSFLKETITTNGNPKCAVPQADGSILGKHGGSVLKDTLWSSNVGLRKLVSGGDQWVRALAL